jgi:hypothetical protein
MINIKNCKFNKEQIKDINLGRKIEMEHTNNKREALKIAKQHECEFNLYYKKGLIPMEKRLSKLNKGVK